MNKPPDGLVQLDSLPRETWVGRSIFHPMSQMGGVPHWREADVPEPMRDPDDESPEVYMYDVGVVTEFMSDQEFYGELGWKPETQQVWFKDPADKGDWKGLHYPDYNVWTLPLDGEQE
jgi:hypothetical protein